MLDDELILIYCSFWISLYFKNNSFGFKNTDEATECKIVLRNDCYNGFI